MKTFLKGLAISVILGVIIAAIFIFAVPVVGVMYYEKEPYTKTETYYESEPYTTTEYYWESEPYTAWEHIEYQVTDSGRDNFSERPNATYWVTIRNTDIKSGYFNIIFNLVTLGGATKTTSADIYIPIGDEVCVEKVHYGDYLKSFTYVISPPSKEVIRYQNVQKSREIVKYKDVAKTREVIDYRNIERRDRVTVFEYLTE